MDRVRKCIASFLLLIIFVPPAYQSAHILLHQDEVHSTHQTSGFVIHEAEANDNCPVCEYEFAHHCLYAYSESSVLAFVFSKDLSNRYTVFNPSYSGIHISLRAPPMQS